MGSFEATIGVMGSAKSSRAIADVKNLRFAGQKVLVMKPKQDDRDGDTISSRLIKDSIKADMVVYPNEKINKTAIIENNYDCIVVDEMHMLDIEVIEDLYEISAVSPTDVHLYGLVMSWKGKPFLSAAYALAYADKIERINITDKQKNLLTHHIKKVGNNPCDITVADGEIETGDLGEDKYSTVSKQTFYEIYGMLGQIDMRDGTATPPRIFSETAGLDAYVLEKGIYFPFDGNPPKDCSDEIDNVSSDRELNIIEEDEYKGKPQKPKTLLGSAHPMVGQQIKLNPRTCERILQHNQFKDVDLYNDTFSILYIDKNIYTINIGKGRGSRVRLRSYEFSIYIEGILYAPYADKTALHDEYGRYINVNSNY